MKATLLVLLVLVVAVTQAHKWFVGGDFVGAHGVSSGSVIRYSSADPEPGFETVHWGNYDSFIKSLDILTGTNHAFVGGDFPGIGTLFSSNVVFYNGTKKQWCPITEGLNAVVTGVRCPTASDCYVIGAFDQVYNVDSGLPRNVSYVAHYRLVSGQWRYVDDLESWSMASQNCENSCSLPSTTDSETIYKVAMLANVPYLFLVKDGSLWRGSDYDAGWVVVSPSSMDGSVSDFSFFDGNMWIVALDADRPMYTSMMFSDDLSNNWKYFITDDDTTRFLSFSHVQAVDQNTRYLACQWNDTEVVVGPRWYICLQQLQNAPVRLGLPFVLPYDNLEELPFDRLLLLPGQDQVTPLVHGGFQGANFLENPDDDAATRNLDNVAYTASWDAVKERWVQPFGGGVDTQPTGLRATAIGDGVALTLYVYMWGDEGSPLIGYNILGNGGIGFDDSETLSEANMRPWFPLVERKLTSRYHIDDWWGQFESESMMFSRTGVYDMLAIEGWVYIAGRFDYHGEERYGSIFRTQWRGEDMATEAVGGGLWKCDHSRPDVYDEPRMGGTVMRLLSDWEDGLFAAGDFDQSGAGTPLRNIARLRNGAEDWEPVGNGCDGPIIALIRWREEIVVGGSFTTCGNKFVNNVAHWNGNEWASLNQGVDGTALSLASFQDRLVVGGTFTTVSGVTTYGAASWDGSSWRALKNGCQSYSCTVNPHRNARIQLRRVISLLNNNSRLFGVALVDSTEEIPSYRFYGNVDRREQARGMFEGRSCRYYSERSTHYYLVEWTGSGWDLVSPIELGALSGDSGPDQWIGDNTFLGQFLAANGTHVVALGAVGADDRTSNFRNNYNYYSYAPHGASFVDSGLAVQEFPWLVRYYDN